MRPALRASPAWIVALVLTLAFGFLGTRGIWDPDEGRYTNVALNMLDTGDWLSPRRSHEVGHWTKPPLTYWAIASSIAVFGPNPWAARLPAAVAYLVCVLLVWRMGKRLVPARAGEAALVYATMAFTVGASQLITTDYVLAACETLALWAFVEARFGARQPRVCLAVMWIAFALAFLTKGPPGLLPLVVVLAFDLLRGAEREHRLFQWSGIVLFVVLALPWYLAVIHDNPGLFRYFIGDEVVNRVTTNEFGRNGEWYGWLKVYAPTLLLGTMPWTWPLLRWARTVPATVRGWWRDPARRREQAPLLLLMLWLLLPLAVFCIARSRLPLYVLPLFAPIALLVAFQREREQRPSPRLAWLLPWIAVLLGLKAGAAYWPTHKDASAWAEAIRARAPSPIEEVVFFEDMARYGLHLHLGRGVQIEKVALDVGPAPPRYNAEYDETLASEIVEHEPGVVWVCKQSRWDELRREVARLGYRAIPLGTPYEERVMFRIEPAAGNIITPADAAADHGGPPPR